MSMLFHATRSMAHSQRAARGISLLEVLVSMFILLFGLVGVASLFPVGKYHMQQATQYDRSAAVGQRAFEEIRVRGLLRPDRWNLQNGARFIDQPNWRTRAVFFDPLAVAPPANSSTVALSTAANTSPLQRVTWRMAGGGNMSLPTATQMFQSHDDLSLELPASRTTPAIQRISASEREHEGIYSWAFMAVPARNMGEGYYEVTAVVFRGRRPGAEWASANTNVTSNAGGFRVRLAGTNDQTSKIKMGEWLLISLQGQQSNRPNYFHWYKVCSITLNNNAGTAFLQLQGIVRTTAFDASIWVTTFGSAVGVYQQIMKVDSDVDWLIE